MIRVDYSLSINIKGMHFFLDKEQLTDARRQIKRALKVIGNQEQMVTTEIIKINGEVYG